MHTSHWGLIGLVIQIAAVAMSPIAGHTIDPNTLNVSMGFTILITVLDWAKRNFTGTH